MKKVSVIVAAYNAHGTLARCLTSLVHQTLEDIEIIAVNDASKDDTWEIMQRCREQFPDKVMILNHEQNLGSGGAKNTGIEAASGEYIGFCDSDDYCASDMYELLYEKAKEKDADIVDCGIFAEAVNISQITTPDEAEGILDDEKRKILILKGGYMCSKIFKRSLFDDPCTRLRPHVSILCDNDFLKYMYLSVNNIWTVKKVLYCYSDAADSNTKIEDMVKYYQSIYGVIEATYEKCHNLPTYEAAKEIVEYAQLVWYHYGIYRCIYNQITSLGTGEIMVGKCFEGLSEDEEDKLKKLALLKKRVITIDYKDNKKVMECIAPSDINIMQECDRRYAS